MEHKQQDHEHHHHDHDHDHDHKPRPQNIEQARSLLALAVASLDDEQAEDAIEFASQAIVNYGFPSEDEILKEASLAVDAAKHVPHEIWESFEVRSRAAFTLQRHSDVVVDSGRALFFAEKAFAGKPRDEELNSRLGLLHFHRGMALSNIGSIKAAVSELETAKNLDAHIHIADIVEELNVELKEEENHSVSKFLSDRRKREEAKVPVTILTGFLGAGKTTMLNNLLRAQKGKKIAVIENEFGQVGIDDKLVAGAKFMVENMVELNTGCICCTVRGDLVQGVHSLMQQHELDGIIIETTGLANPAPVIQTFYVDPVACKTCRVDGVITVVDSKHVVERLRMEREQAVGSSADASVVDAECHQQLAFADVIILNKLDLLGQSAEEQNKAADKVEEALRDVNGFAKVIRTTNSVVSVDQVMGIKAFSLDHVLQQVDDKFLHDRKHSHNESVTSFSVRLTRPLQQDAFEDCMQWIIGRFGEEQLYRMKGVLAFEHDNKKFAIQGVHTIVRNSIIGEWGPDEARITQLVFIGSDLNEHRSTIEARLQSCVSRDVALSAVSSSSSSSADKKRAADVSTAPTTAPNKRQKAQAS